MRASLLVITVLLSSVISMGRDVEIRGSAPGASGEYIHVFRQPDPVTARYVSIDRIRVNDSDIFSFSTPCDGICWLRLRLGIYEFIIVIEEEHSYDIQLPAYRPLTEADRLNPFFEYKTIHLRMEGDESVNNNLRYIDSLYYQYAELITGSIYRGEKLPNKDSLLLSFSEAGALLRGVYQERYYRYRYILLKLMAERRRTPEHEYIETINKHFYPRMPAYTDLVRQVFNGYTARLAGDAEAAELRQLILSGGSYRDILKLITGQGMIRDTALLEFVLLDNLFAEYYKGTYSKESVEHLFEWMSQEATDKYNRDLAKLIINKLRGLKPGARPPDFELVNTEGEVLSLDSLLGSFTILGFGSTKLPETAYELDMLEQWVGEYRDRLTVVMVIVDENFLTALEEAGYNRYDFIFLDGSLSDELLRDYDIRYLPTFYFLDRETRLIFSPSPMPSENLRRSVVPKLVESLGDDIVD